MTAIEMRGAERQDSRVQSSDSSCPCAVSTCESLDKTDSSWSFLSLREEESPKFSSTMSILELCALHEVPHHLRKTIGLHTDIT